MHQYGRWYEPPVSFTGLAKAACCRASQLTDLRQTQYLASTFIPHPWLRQQDFSRFVLDFLVFGNAFLEKRYSTTVRSSTGNLTGKIYPPWCGRGCLLVGAVFNEPTAFAPGSVFHLLEPDINQELYGLPEYLSALTLPG
ncbi:phage capsid protein [Escherichia coli]|uniref:Phage capsid protein n=1 Tax=Escherichia coli TaxID=562 RepID=A0A2X1NFA4_ECOLX|nr:phage capsid protein [Escherichia coli]